MVVREWRAEDAADLALQANDRRVWLNMRDAFPHPYGIEGAELSGTAGGNPIGLGLLMLFGVVTGIVVLIGGAVDALRSIR